MSDAAAIAKSSGTLGLGPGSKRFALGLFLVALLQTAVLGWMVYDRITLLKTGKEVTLDVVPVDPRSLFRGDYVILNYGFSRLDPEALEGDDDFAPDDPVFVTLSKTDGAAWQATSVSKAYPAEIRENAIVLRGRVRSRGAKLRVDYGIESYFVPEGEGKALERQVRSKNMQVLVAVAADGEAAIKGILVDGELRYEEPLF